MKSTTRGIILHTVPYSETSLVVKAYTEDSGLTSYICNGVRNSKGRIKASLFQPLTLVEITASVKPGASMSRITDIQLAPPYTGIPSSVIKSSIVMFLSEVVYRSIREAEPDNNLFEFMHSGLQILDCSQDNCSRFHIYFMIRLSKYFGFYPNGAYREGTSYFDLKEGVFTDFMPLHPEFIEQKETGILWQYMQSSFENFHEVRVPDHVASGLLESLVFYYELHFTHGQQIRSHLVLKEVLH